MIDVFDLAEKYNWFVDRKDEFIEYYMEFEHIVLFFKITIIGIVLLLSILFLFLILIFLFGLDANPFLEIEGIL